MIGVGICKVSAICRVFGVTRYRPVSLRDVQKPLTEVTKHENATAQGKNFSLIYLSLFV
jgi:hypothetical protein